MIRWHYSLATYLDPIKRSRRLLATAGSITPRAVWFSSNQTIERTARGYYKPEKKMPDAGTAIRFGVPDTFPLVHWPAVPDWWVPRITVETLESSALQVFGTSPAEWWITPSSVLLKELCAIECWDGKAWRDMDFRSARTRRAGARERVVLEAMTALRERVSK